MSVREAASKLLARFNSGPQHIVDSIMLRSNSPEIVNLRAALADDEDASTVRVPIEPTETMLDAGYRTEADDGTPRDIWVAMIAAMQEPKEAGS